MLQQEAIWKHSIYSYTWNCMNFLAIQNTLEGVSKILFFRGFFVRNTSIISTISYIYGPDSEVSSVIKILFCSAPKSAVLICGLDQTKILKLFIYFAISQSNACGIKGWHIKKKWNYLISPEQNSQVLSSVFPPKFHLMSPLLTLFILFSISSYCTVFRKLRLKLRILEISGSIPIFDSDVIRGFESSGNLPVHL